MHKSFFWCSALSLTTWVPAAVQALASLYFWLSRFMSALSGLSSNMETITDGRWRHPQRGSIFVFLLHTLTQRHGRDSVCETVGQERYIVSLTVIESVTDTKSRSQSRCRETLLNRQGMVIHSLRNPSCPPRRLAVRGQWPTIPSSTGTRRPRGHVKNAKVTGEDA